MTRLRRGESLQADGIRDMMQTQAFNGSSDSMAMNSTKIWEKQPYRGGGVHTTTKGTTSTHSFNDHYGVIKFAMGNQSSTFSSTKTSVTESYVGWGTTGGVQAASGGSLVGNQGTAYDGTSTITNSAIPFSYLAPNADANKWLEFCGYFISTAFGATFSAKLVFSGSGAQTTDTDWTKIHVSLDAENAYNSVYNPYLSSVSVTTLERTAASSVLSSSNRIIYSWNSAVMGLEYKTNTTADFVTWIKFE